MIGEEAADPQVDVSNAASATNHNLIGRSSIWQENFSAQNANSVILQQKGLDNLNGLGYHFNKFCCGIAKDGGTSRLRKAQSGGSVNASGWLRARVIQPVSAWLK